MQLYDKASGKLLREGDPVETRSTTGVISGLGPEKRQVFIMPDKEDANPFAVPASAIGAEWR